MFCTKCGNEIPEDNAFCTKCGAPARAPHRTEADSRSPSPHAGYSAPPDLRSAEVKPSAQSALKTAKPSSLAEPMATSPSTKKGPGKLIAIVIAIVAIMAAIAAGAYLIGFNTASGEKATSEKSASPEVDATFYHHTWDVWKWNGTDYEGNSSAYLKINEDGTFVLKLISGYEHKGTWQTIEDDGKDPLHAGGGIHLAWIGGDEPLDLWRSSDGSFDVLIDDSQKYVFAR